MAFDARKVNSHEDYLSLLDSAKINKADVVKLGALRKRNPKQFRDLLYGKLVPRGVIPADLRFKSNKAPDDGLQWINQVLRAASAASITHNMMGKGSTAPVTGDIELETVIAGARHAINDRYPDGKTINHYDTFWLSTEGNDGGASVNWTESGLFNASAGVTLIFRLTFSAVNKTKTKSMNVAWSSTLASLT